MKDVGNGRLIIGKQGGFVVVVVVVVVVLWMSGLWIPDPRLGVPDSRPILSESRM